VAGLQRPSAGRQLPQVPGRHHRQPEHARVRESLGHLEEPSWRIVGSYKFTPKLFTYLTVSRGYKAGGYNDQTGTSGLMVAELTRPVDPEFATNYELGMKWESADSRFRFNPTVFYTTYEDAQRAVNIITVKNGAQFQETVFYNAAKVESKGVELEFQAALTDSFRLRAQAAYLDASYKEFVINQPGISDPASGGEILPFTADYSGLPVPRSPEWSGSIQGVSPWTLRQRREARLRGGLLPRGREPVLHLGRGPSVRCVPGREEPDQRVGDLYGRRMTSTYPWVMART
jgi:iron complex outermembrane receptor protein